MNDMFFGLNAPVNDDELVLLRTFHDDISVAMAEEVLRDEGILFVKKDRGSGSAVRIVVGFSTFGTDLFVAPDDLERATELMQALFAVDYAIREEQESEQ